MRAPLRLLEDSFSLFKEHWKLFTGIFLVQGLAFGVLAFFMFVAFGFADPTTNGILSVIMSLPAIMVLVLALIVVSVLMAIALVLAVENPSLTVMEAYKKALPFFWHYLWLSFLVGLVTLVGFLLLIIPGIIFSVWFAFSLYIFLFEGVKGIAAMKRSRALVRGRFMPVFLRFLLLIGVTFLVSLCLGIVEGIAKGSLVGVIISNALYLVVHVVLTPVSIIYVYLLYRDLKSTESTIAAPVQMSSASAAETSDFDGENRD